MPHLGSRQQREHLNEDRNMQKICRTSTVYPTKGQPYLNKNPATFFFFFHFYCLCCTMPVDEILHNPVSLAKRATLDLWHTTKEKKKFPSTSWQILKHSSCFTIGGTISYLSGNFMHPSTYREDFFFLSWGESWKIKLLMSSLTHYSKHLITRDFFHICTL